MKPIYVLIAAIALTSAQKSGKQGGGGKQHGVASYQSYPEQSSHKSYPSAPAYQSQHNGGQSYGGGSYNGGAAASQKQAYPVLLSDNRQFNHDGTINYQYAADNGLQQGETVDPDGTRRGFYSYIGADGKPLTVKYTAGKNGFVAEGDHLPKQPSSVPAESTKDEAVSKNHYQGQGGGNSGSSGDYDDGSYHPELYERPYASSGGASNSPSGGGQYYGGAPAHYSAATQNHAPAQAQAPYRPAGPVSRPRYSPPSPYHDGPNYGGSFGGQSSHGQYQGSPQTQYTQAVPPYSGGGGHRGGVMHSAINPYSPAGPAGPYAGQFDLGNGGQFSINFEPGQSQELGGPQGAYSNPRPSRPRYN